MTRSRLLTAVLFVLAIAARSKAESPAGNWRLTVELGGGASITYLLSFAEQGGAWTGRYLGRTDPAPVAAAIKEIFATGDRLRFVLTLDGEPYLFDGKLAASGNSISGTLSNGDAIVMADMARSHLTAFDRAALLKEIVQHGEAGSALYNAVADLLSDATALKAGAGEVRAWAEQALKAAEGRGVRWQVIVALRLARVLTDQPAYADVALSLVQRAQNLLTATDEAALQISVLELAQQLLEQLKKPAEAAALTPRITTLELRDEREERARAPFQPPPTPARKSPSDRAVLVELFTGSECTPCVAAEWAFDAILEAYKPTDVVALEYHLHMPGPDPMTNPVAEMRRRYCKILGTPSVVFNGKAAAGGGGPAAAAAKKFADYQKVLTPILESPAGTKLTLRAERAGDRIQVQAQVSGLTKLRSSAKLRLVLVENFVRYRGGNGLRIHYNVVRAMIGPAEGTALTTANGDYDFALDLNEVRRQLAVYLEQFQKSSGAMFLEKPLKLSRLHVAAWIQDDASQDVLQAAQATVP